MKRVSLKDVAKMAGVSKSTASFVLNGKAKAMRISEALAEKVIAVAEKAGYQPHQLAVSLRTGQSKILGLIVESISGSFFAALAKIIEDEAEVYGYKVVYCSTENNALKGRELIRMLSQRHVDGYLITPTIGMEKDIKKLVALEKPVVLMDSYFPEVESSYVLVDNANGVKQGMDHFFKKGYKKIGFVTVDIDLVQMNDRLAAYHEALAAHGVRPNKKLILRLPYNGDKKDAIEQINAFLKNAPGLDAVFFATNYLGILGVESITSLGLRMPQDIAMICFDDHDLFRLYPPGITAIQQPIEGIAKTAMKLLMQQMDKGKTGIHHNQVELEPHFVERGST